MKKIYWIPPSFFASRSFRPSRNPVTRIRNCRRVNGPSLVLKNALIGLKQIDVVVEKDVNFQFAKFAPCWIPAGTLSTLSKAEIDILSETNLTLGPNIDWFNAGNVDVVSQLKQVKILVPHHWVILTIEQVLPKNCRILVWYSGIDTVFWQRSKNDPRLLKVLIYVKNLRDVENRAHAEDYLRNRQIDYEVLEYGSYSQSQFKTVLNQVNAAIWIGGTESQGLALLECWTMNVPTLVLKNTIWRSPDGRVYPASSAPFMSAAAGRFSNSDVFCEEDFEDFFSTLKSFSPREWVEEPFSLTNCASRLLVLLES